MDTHSAASILIHVPHSGELAVQLGNDLAHSLGGTGATGDDVVARGAAATPVLLRRTVDGLLGGRNGVDRGHEPLLEAELVVDDLGQWRQAVGGAGRVGDNVHARLVRGVVDAHDEHGGVGRRGRDDDLLRSTLEMSRRLVDGGEDSRGFDHVVRPGIAPGNLARVHLVEDADRLLVDADALLVNDGDLSLVGAVRRVKAQLVGRIFGGNERIIKRLDEWEAGSKQKGVEPTAMV
jgi:hypothetical protein